MIYLFISVSTFVSVPLLNLCCNAVLISAKYKFIKSRLNHNSTNRVPKSTQLLFHITHLSFISCNYLIQCIPYSPQYLHNQLNKLLATNHYPSYSSVHHRSSPFRHLRNHLSHRSYHRPYSHLRLTPPHHSLTRRPLTVTPDLQFARTVSFNRENSYVRMYPAEIGRTFAMTMRVKTNKADGLLFYTFNKDRQTFGLSIGLSAGKFVVKVTSNGRYTVVTSVISTYADGAWHYISVDISSKMSVVQLYLSSHYGTY